MDGLKFFFRWLYNCKKIKKDEEDSKIIDALMVEENDFPIHMGVVFLEGTESKNKRKSLLNFDQNACSYLLLQLNNIQQIFEFDIINTGIKDHSLPSHEELRSKYRDDILYWFDSLLLQEVNKT